MVAHSDHRHKRTHKIGVIMGGIALILMLAIIAIVIFSESLLRYLIENRGSKALGRELTVSDVDIDWGSRNTYVRVNNIQLDNAHDYAESEMVDVESVELTVNPWNLLRGKIELGVIKIDKPIIVLERKSETDNNWTFASPTDSQTVQNNDRTSFPVIERLQVTGGQITFRDAIRKLNLELDLDSVSGTDDVDSSSKIRHEFTITGKGQLQDRPFSLTASAGSLETLRDPSADFPLDLKLRMDKTRVTLAGVFNDPIKLNGMNATLTVRGDNLADLFYLTAIPLPPTPSYKLKGQLTKQGNVWAYEDFSGEVGGSDLSGSLSYDVSGERGFLKANLTSNVLDSTDLGGFIGLPPPADDEKATPEQKQAAAEKEASPRLIPDVPLNVERLRATDLDVTLSAKAIEAPNLPFKGMEARLNLREGKLVLDPLNVVLADGTLDGTFHLDASQDVPPMKANINLRKLSLNQFFRNTRFAETTEGFFGGRIDLTGRGESLADVLATSNGEMALIMSGGKVSRLLVEAADIDIGEAVPLFFGEDKATKIRCAVIDFDAKDGVLTSDTFVLDTGDSQIVGKATIDLKQEQLNARLDAKPKDNSLLAARIPITLSGDLKSPSIGLDARRTGARGAAAIALGALLSPFAALLAFVDDGDAKDVNCRELINAAQ